VRLLTAYDTTFLGQALTIDVATPIDSTGTPGLVASTPDCSEIWWPAANGVFSYRVADGSVRQAVEGLGPVRGLVPDGDGSIVALAGLGSGAALDRVDLTTGDLARVMRSDVSHNQWAVAALLDRGEIAIATVDVGSDTSGETTHLSTVGLYDVGTGESLTGSARSSAAFSQLATCGSPSRLFALGVAPDDGPGTRLIEITDDGFAESSVQVSRPVASSPPPDWSAEPEGGFAISSDCRYVYFLAGGLWRFDREHGRTLALPATPAAIALDPRQDVLYLDSPSQNRIEALDLHTFASSVVATGVPFVDQMLVTQDGKLVIGGRHGLDVGVIDLASGATRRLWEGSELNL